MTESKQLPMHDDPEPPPYEDDLSSLSSDSDSSSELDDSDVPEELDSAEQKDLADLLTWDQRPPSQPVTRLPVLATYGIAPGVD